MVCIMGTSWPSSAKMNPQKKWRRSASADANSAHPIAIRGQAMDLACDACSAASRAGDDTAPQKNREPRAAVNRSRRRLGLPASPCGVRALPSTPDPARCARWSRPRRLPPRDSRPPRECIPPRGRVPSISASWHAAERCSVGSVEEEQPAHAPLRSPRRDRPPTQRAGLAPREAPPPMRPRRRGPLCPWSARPFYTLPVVRAPLYLQAPPWPLRLQTFEQQSEFAAQGEPDGKHAASVVVVVLVVVVVVVDDVVVGPVVLVVVDVVVVGN